MHLGMPHDIGGKRRISNQYVAGAESLCLQWIAVVVLSLLILVVVIVLAVVIVVVAVFSCALTVYSLEPFMLMSRPGISKPSMNDHAYECTIHMSMLKTQSYAYF